MARPLIVESKPVARVTEPVNSAIKGLPVHLAGRARVHGRSVVGRRGEGMARENVFDVRQEQFLVLLFVSDSEGDEVGYLRRNGVRVSAK